MAEPPREPLDNRKRSWYCIRRFAMERQKKIVPVAVAVILDKDLAQVLLQREIMNRVVGTMEQDNTLELLRASLSCAVPLWIERIKSRNMTPEEWVKFINERREQCVGMIASHGDDILFRSKKPGGTAAAFNALAESIAIMAFVPGGVRAFGLHFEEKQS